MAFTDSVEVATGLASNYFSLPKESFPMVRLSTGQLICVVVEATTFHLLFYYSDDNGATWTKATTEDVWTAWVGVHAVYATEDDVLHVVASNGANGYYSTWQWSGTDGTRDAIPASITPNPTYKLGLVVFDDPDDSANYRILVLIDWSTYTSVREWTRVKASPYTTTYVGEPLQITAGDNQDRIEMQWQNYSSVPLDDPPIFCVATTNTSYQNRTYKFTWNGTGHYYQSAADAAIAVSANYFRGSMSELRWDTVNSKWMVAGRENASTNVRVYYFDAGGAGTQLGSTITARSVNEEISLQSDGSTLYLFFFSTSGADDIEYCTYDLTAGLAGSWSSIGVWSAGTDVVAASDIGGLRYTYNEAGGYQLDVVYAEGATTTVDTIKLHGTWSLTGAGGIGGWGWIPI